MADGKKLIERKFLIEKKAIKLEDMKLYVEEYHPQDMKWFYNLCLTEQPIKEDEPNGEKGILSFLAIKSRFYKKYFQQEDALTQRMKLFSDWDIPSDEETEAK